MDLVSAWKTVDLNTCGPRILECDREVLKRRQRDELDVCYASWQDFLSDPSSFQDGNQLLLNRFPMPYAGDLSKASIFILTLNPGHELADYYFEFEDDIYRQALVNNLKQENLDPKFPFFPLNPRFCKTGAYAYWFTKLRGIITRLIVRRKMTFDEAHSKLAREIAVIELVPYASVDSGPLGNLHDNLPSSRLAKEFVKRCVGRKVHGTNPKAIAILHRRSKIWKKALQITSKGNQGVYFEGSNLRNPSFKPSSKFGKAILKQLQS